MATTVFEIVTAVNRSIGGTIVPFSLNHFRVRSYINVSWMKRRGHDKEEKRIYEERDHPCVWAIPSLESICVNYDMDQRTQNQLFGS